MTTQLSKKFRISILLFLLFTSINKVINAQECKTYSNNTLRTIPDLQRAYSSVVVDIVGTVTDVNIVNFSGYHTCISDINLELTSPSGTKVMFINFSGCCPQIGHPFKTKFDDSGSTGSFPCPLNDNIAHKPTHGNLSTFNGEPAAGTWTLLFDDVVGVDCGFLCGFSLEVSTGGVCTGVAPDAADCPVLSRPLTCDEIENIFDNGIGVLPVLSECKIFSNSSMTFISDTSQTVSTVNVTLSGRITYVKIVNFAGYHSYSNDVKLTLTSPNGTSVTFINNSLTCGATPINIKFDDAGAVTAYPCPLNNGVTYKAINGNFSDFNGQSPFGTWSLTIDHNVGGNCGFLCAWSLEISTGAACAEASDAVTCPRLEDSYTCAELKTIFTGGNTTLPIPVITSKNRHILIKDKPKDPLLGVFYSFHWVNYSNSIFDSKQGVLAIDNTVKFIYKIVNNTIVTVNYGSSSLDSGYNKLMIDSDSINIQKKYYVAWLVDLDVKFCNCSRLNKISSGTGIANVIFTLCQDRASSIVEDLKLRHPNIAIIVQKETEQLAYIVGTTKFKDVAELKGFFNGEYLAEELLFCKQVCSA